MKIDNIKGYSFKGVSLDNASQKYLAQIVDGLNEISVDNQVYISEKEEQMGVFHAKNMHIEVQESAVKSKNPFKNAIYKIFDAVHPATRKNIVFECFADRDGVLERIFQLKGKFLYDHIKKNLKDILLQYESVIVYRNLEKLKKLIKG